MKILLLNPHVDAGQKTAKALQKTGAAVLLPADSTEAWQMLQLHGSSVDLAILHRESAEGKAAPGLDVVAKIKADPAQADLPVILTSSQWGDAECAAHQDTPQGANAYLKAPYTEPQLFQLIEAVLGVTLEQLAPASPAAPTPKAPVATQTGLSPAAVGKPTAPAKAAAPTKSKNDFAAPTGGTLSGLILEDASQLFNSSKYEASETSIKLEAPEGAPPPPKAEEVVADSPSIALSIDAPAAEAPAAEAPATGLELSVAPSVEAPAETAAPAAGLELSVAPAAEPALELSPAAAYDSAPAEEIPSPSIELSIPTAGSIPTSSTQQFTPNGDPEPSLGKLDLASLTRPGQPLSSTKTVPMTDPDAAYSAPSPESEAIIAEQMPYLLSGAMAGTRTVAQPTQQPGAPSSFAQAVGDAVVPGGAAQSPDLETLKKYLLLREQDVAALSTQFKSAKDQLGAVEDLLRQERGKNIDLSHTVDEQKRKIDDAERDKRLALETLQTELNEMRFQIKAKTDKARLLESQVREATEEMERLKERVRQDIRKIRVREKELENRLEIMKKDSEALIGARENKIIELKRKLDLLEFNMDLLQDQYAREKEGAAKLRERLAKAAQVVRVAGGLLDSPAASAIAGILEGDSGAPDGEREAS